MSKINIEIKNAKEIKMAFLKSPAVMTKNLNSAITRVAYKVGRDSRRFTPVDTGRLRSSTYEKIGNLRAVIGTKTSYDIYVHDGTRFMKARPFLANSVEVNQGFTDTEFSHAVEKTLDSIVRSAR